MKTDLQVAFLDVAADGLVWALGLAPQDALAVLDVPLGGLDAQLRILGASHQVLLALTDDDSTTVLSETVACLDIEQARPLPDHVSRHVDTPAGRLSYEFHSHVLNLPPPQFSARTAEIRERAARSSTAVVAAFPGDEDAITAIELQDTGPCLTWQTAHAYPNVGELVLTATTVTHPTHNKGNGR